MRNMLIENIQQILIEQVKFKDNSNILDKYFDYIEKNSFYFEVSLYFPHSNDEFIKYGHKKLLLTKEWLLNFCDKHKEEITKL